MTETDTPEKSNAWERHAQTIIGAVIIALILWAGVTLNQLTTSSAVTQQKINHTQEKVLELAGDLERLNSKVDGGILPKTELEIKRLETVLKQHQKNLDSLWPRLREMKERIQRLEPKGADRWQH